MEFRKIRKLIPLKNYLILALFDDGEWRKYDLKPLMEKYPQFRKLEDESLHLSAKIDLDGFGIAWNEELDLSAQSIYLDGEKVKEGENL